MFAWVSLGVVLVSTFTFVLGTFPEFQKEEDTGQPPPYPEAVLVMEVVGMFTLTVFTYALCWVLSR